LLEIGGQPRACWYSRGHAIDAAVPAFHLMKFIQLFNRYLQRGGEEKSVARIATHLELSGHQVARFWRSSAEWTGSEAPSKVRQLFLLWRNDRVLEEIRELHAEVKPDAWILHNVIPVISLRVYRLAIHLNVPIIQWLHNYRPLSPGGTLRWGARSLRPDDPLLCLKDILAGNWRGRFLTAWLALAYATMRFRGDYSSVRAWIAVSDEMRRIFERGGWPTDRMYTLHHSWDIQVGALDEKDGGYFLFLGRMIENKGVKFLVDLWRDPSLRSVPLVMAGEGPLAEVLRATSPPNVRWAGYVEGNAKRELVGGCRAVVFPALWDEPLSTVAYEAYEMGKPLISSQVGGMTELVSHEETGCLLEKANVVEWQKAVLRFHHDPASARRLGRNGRKWLEENVSPKRWSEKFNRIAERALGAAPNLDPSYEPGRP
jgi:glycosyltransferase involved in cell wall biosynthesis